MITDTLKQINIFQFFFHIHTQTKNQEVNQENITLVEHLVPLDCIVTNIIHIFSLQEV